MNQQKVLCIPKACVTRAMGGKLGHGIHPLPQPAVMETIEPNVEYRLLGEIADDGSVIQLFPCMIVPRTIVDPETNLVDISLPVYRLKTEDSSRVAISFFSHIFEEDKACKPDDSIDFTNTVYRAIHRTLGVQMGVRVTDAQEDHAEMQIAATQMIVIDHSTDVSNKCAALLYLACLPLGLDAFALDSENENFGYVSVKDIKEKYSSEMIGFARLIVDQLINNQDTHNAAVTASKS